MCGLVGLLLDYDPGAGVDLAPLERAEAALGSWHVEQAGAGQALCELAEGLERLSRALVGWGGFRTLRDDAAGRERVSRVAGGLREAAEAVDARLADARRVSSSQETESLSRGAVVARDVAWRLDHDALPNLAAAASMAPAGWEPGLKGWFELWRLNLVLNQLARLEVRGRDSGGLATLVHFDAEAWGAAQEALAAAGLAGELARREGIACLKDGAILCCSQPAGGKALAFAHKVAKEVGELGANVAELRGKIAGDAVYRTLLALPGARVQVMAHTRWASNGIINEANCHPVANDLARGGLEEIVLGVLNGDVDNYPSLAPGWEIPAECTTDAKIIPLEVTRHLKRGAGAGTATLTRQAVDQAFCAAVSSFTGSTAIAVLASHDPETVHLALRGSGQAIYVGVLDEGGYLFASELYGVVELAPRYYKLEGDGGEVVRLRMGHGAAGLERVGYDGGERALADEDLKTAAIATRDIDRGGFPHYLLKEINEAPRSVERTLRGKFILEEEGRYRFLLGDDVIPAALRVAVSERRLRRVLVIGQGTAAVAGQAAAEYMDTLLRPAGIEVRGLPATELSGWALDGLGPDTLVVAVSQSGTTTDTNRTVDLARGRGALVVAIVNRRGSDLVDKSHGVLYTSDGRDVEMSVASTKAFYCQVVAGYLLGLQLAALAGTLDERELAQSLLRLSDLPRCLREVLESSRERVRLGAQLAVHRRHWTVVGSGPVLQAAREIRIKLSELCYKSVPVDTIEDKKHIDLSSEPMILVCAAGLSGPAAADAVKEVAIFKAHAAAPVVICDRGETRFSEYAEVTIPVPASTPEVALLLNTIAGHLFSYETALAIDRCTTPLKSARDVAEAALAALNRAVGSGPSPQDVRQIFERLQKALSPVAREVFAQLRAGAWNAGFSADAAMRLSTVLRVALGQVPVHEVRPGLATAPQETLEFLLVELGWAVDTLRRPIDAIKHQAKTVTVGISREAEGVRPEGGVLEQALVAAGVEGPAIADPDAAALAALDAAVDEVVGVVHYGLRRLDPLGGPVDGSEIYVVAKTGAAAGMASRADQGAQLRGTKRMIVRSPEVWVGRGQRDGRTLICCPLYAGGLISGLALVHVHFKERLTTRERVRALRAAGRYEDVKCLVTERDVAWSDALLQRIAVAELLTTAAEALAERLVTQAPAEAAASAPGPDPHSDTAALVSPFLAEDGPGRPGGAS